MAYIPVHEFVNRDLLVGISFEGLIKFSLQGTLFVASGMSYVGD